MTPLQICDLLPGDLSPEERSRRVMAAAALFRQALFTLEVQGLPGPAVMAVAQYVLDHEAVVRAAQEARTHV